MRARLPTFALGALAGLFFGIPLLLVGGYIWQAGLDLRSPSSSREWTKLCARAREDIFCKAAKDVVAREVTGPFVLIYPGINSDRDLTAALTVWKGHYPTDQELDALVRANLFLGIDLSVGEVRSLDGQLWQISRPADQKDAYKIGPLRVYRHTRPANPDDGAVYITLGPSGHRTFLSPR